jgi:hypothetical protein
MKKTGTEQRRRFGFKMQKSHILSTATRRRVVIVYRIGIQNSLGSILYVRLYRKFFGLVLA